MHTTFVFAGGPYGSPPDPGSFPTGTEADLVVAVDSGLHVAQDLGVPMDLVVGDLDSVDTDRLERAVATGAVVDRHPVDKDVTDLELGLDAARAAGTDRIVVLASAGGRLDHLLGVVAALGAPRLDGVEVEAHIGPARVLPVHDRRELGGRPGELVSLLAVGGPAVGVRTEGLKWTLDGATLEPGSGWGLSNRFVTDTAVVEVAAGRLVVVIPGVES
jgi:thiamine pyrophosphokinase